MVKFGDRKTTQKKEYVLFLFFWYSLSLKLKKKKYWVKKKILRSFKIFCFLFFEVKYDDELKKRLPDGVD